MPEIKLGRLEQVQLRKAWSHEAVDFTPWLASAENLALLGETLGLQLELEGIEQDVGPFRADILCREVEDDRLVLIENQLERTDHTHLGQLITYTAGLDTATIVWIAAEFTAQHRSALDWLNATTGEQFRFFGIEVELWRIGESSPAPRFKIISQPNAWTTSVSRAVRAVQSGELTEIGRLRHGYWAGFRRYLEETGRNLRLTKDYASGNIPFPVPGSEFVIVAYRSVGGPGVFVRVRAGRDSEYHDALWPHRGEISAAAGGVPFRRYDDPASSSWMHAFLKSNPRDEADWRHQFAWLTDTIERSQHALGIAVERLQAPPRDTAA